METQDQTPASSPESSNIPAESSAPESGAYDPASTSPYKHTGEPIGKPAVQEHKSTFKDRLAAKALKNGLEFDGRVAKEKDPAATAPEPKTPQAAPSGRAPDSAAKRTGATVVPPSADPVVPATPEETPPPGEPGEYTPNYKFKVMDKEHEIPEFLRSAITDPESERKIKELHEKAMGLDIVKPRFQQERERSKQLGDRVGVYASKVETLRKHYGRKDFGAIFSELSLPENEVLQYFVEKAKYNELTDGEKQAHDLRQQAQQQAWTAEDRVEKLQGSLEQNSEQAKRTAAQHLLAKPDVQAFAKSFESQPGRKPGDFWDAMCDEGDYAYLKSKGQQDLMPEEVFEAVKRRYGSLAAVQTVPANANPPAPAPAPAAPAAAAPAPQAPVAKPKPGVIPNVAGKASSSPTPQRVRSIADIKKLSKSFQ